MTSLRAAAVIDGLVALAESLFGDEVAVVDGPRSKKVSATKTLFIGWDHSSPVHAIAHRDESTLDADPTETGEIACYIATRSGNANMKEVRDDAVDILTRLEDAIRADAEGLGGACDLAEIGPDAGIWQDQTQQGATIGLPFSVQYTAYL